MLTHHRVTMAIGSLVTILNEVIRMRETLMPDDGVKLGSLSVDRQLYPLIDSGLDLLATVEKLRKDLTPMADGQWVASYRDIATGTYVLEVIDEMDGRRSFLKFIPEKSEWEYDD